MDCPHKTSMIDCPCTFDCPRHGKCCDCVAFHIDFGKPPVCLAHLYTAETEEK